MKQTTFNDTSHSPHTQGFNLSHEYQLPLQKEKGEKIPPPRTSPARVCMHACEMVW
jgi:hypothetical protein